MPPSFLRHMKGGRASRWKTRPEPPKKIREVHPRGRLDRANNQEECERHRRCNPKLGIGGGSICRPRWTSRPEL